jgi:hypothetical protein
MYKLQEHKVYHMQTAEFSFSFASSIVLDPMSSA